MIRLLAQLNPVARLKATVLSSYRFRILADRVWLRYITHVTLYAQYSISFLVILLWLYIVVNAAHMLPISIVTLS